MRSADPEGADDVRASLGPPRMNVCPTCSAHYPPEVPLCPHDGAVLGNGLLDQRYKILSRLGEGGMGIVYAAEHVGLRKPVAVKMLRGDFAKDPQVLARFEQE